MVTQLGHNEAGELDRRIDLVNVVFGAALGGYIGVVMTRKDLTLNHSAVLTLVLLVTVCLLVAVRSILHIWRGTSRGTWKLPLAVVICGIWVLAAMRGDTYLDMSVLIPIFIGWLAAFAVVIAAHIFYHREFEDGR